MKHIGLFEGIGGFSLAASWMDWKTIAWCEWNLFGQQVLKYHFPKATGHGDITKTDFTIYRGKCDIITGGFPCQPYSHAGKRLGKEDERHLWPEMLRAIREIQPAWVVGENVSGLISWNGGLVFHEVQTDLEIEGYEVFPVVLPAASVGSCPHRRDRVWFIAYSISAGTSTSAKGCDQSRELFQESGRQQDKQQHQPFGAEWTTPNANQPPTEHAISTGRNVLAGNDRNAANTEPKGRKMPGRVTGSVRFKPGTWDNWPTTEPVIRGGDDGIPTELDGITFSKWRNESIKAYGNAVVPQVVFQIFKAIENIT